NGVGGSLLRHRSVAPRLALFALGPVHAEDRRERAELDPARVIFIGWMTAETTAVHAPPHRAHIDCTQHTRALPGHGLEAGVDVARPQAIGIALRAEPEVAVERPHPRIGLRTLRVVQR